MRCMRCSGVVKATLQSQPRRSRDQWAGDAGDAAGARDQFAALLPVRKRVPGAEHPVTLTRGNLARWTGKA